MTRSVIAALFFAATLGLTVAIADDEKPKEPEKQPEKAKAKTTRGFGDPAPLPERGISQFPTRTATTLARYEEEAEVLEAQLDVKKAYIKAAEASLAGVRVKFANITTLQRKNVVSKDELDLAKSDLDLAEANLEIRKAEMKEVEVKVKYAKKRLEDAKANAAPRPAPRPAFDPKPADPRQ